MKILSNGEHIEKEIINKLEDFIVKNKALIKKLIIIIDDVDETSENTVEECVRHFFAVIGMRTSV